jgi:hypothetical protein
MSGQSIAPCAQPVHAFPIASPQMPLPPCHPPVMRYRRLVMATVGSRKSRKRITAATLANHSSPLSPTQRPPLAQHHEHWPPAAVASAPTLLALNQSSDHLAEGAYKKGMPLVHTSNRPHFLQLSATTNLPYSPLRSPLPTAHVVGVSSNQANPRAPSKLGTAIRTADTAPRQPEIAHVVVVPPLNPSSH